MRGSLSIRSLMIFATVAIVAGCGESQSPLTFSNPTQSVPSIIRTLPGAPLIGTLPARAGRSFRRPVSPDLYSVLYNFVGPAADGLMPTANLIDVGGTLYGTTLEGGGCGNRGCGTVFSMSTLGVENWMYSFTGAPTDGYLAYSDLLNVGGKLYGTTFYGGNGTSPECYTAGCGVVYAITTAGAESVLHNFQGVSGGDGSFSQAGLVHAGNTLYGTTYAGGTGSCSGGCGTIFSLTTLGAEHILYNFAGPPDGALPATDMIRIGNKLYGTTSEGGTGSCPGGCGTVFRINRNGLGYTVLHSFAGPPTDGELPVLQGLIAIGNTLYGTTQIGGTNSEGVLYSITTAGVEAVLYNFGAGPNDGVYPTSSLLHLGGKLFGTAARGGGAANDGTVFRFILPNGPEQSIHKFAGSPADGAVPEAGIIRVNGKLYGTTYEGGSGSCSLGCGIVYK